MYAESYAQNDVLNLDPLEAVCRLYAKAIEKLNQALEHLEAGRIEPRSAAIAHASEIVLELQASLNAEKGGEIAKELARIYDYIQEKLTDANAQQKAEGVEEAIRLLETLYAGWKQCRAELIPDETPESGAESEPEVEPAVAETGRAWTL